MSENKPSLAKPEAPEFVYVYFIRAKTSPPTIKIGKAVNPKDRLRELQVGCPHRLWIEGKIRCYSEKHAFEVENSLHKLFESQRVRGEWFSFRGIVLETVMMASHSATPEKRQAFKKRFLNVAKSRQVLSR